MSRVDIDPFSAEFKSIAESSVRRAVASLEQRAPLLTIPTLKWLTTHCDIQKPEEYFLHPNALTLFSLPWWLELSLQRTVDSAFQGRLMEASTNLYYFARMLDDLMDGHPTEKSGLPALYPFLLDFQRIFFEYFPASHVFWTCFHRYMDETAEAASVDASLIEIGEKEFRNIAAHKTIAAMVPVAAVCFRYGREDLLPAWEDYFHSFACWHQFRNDLLGWSGDAERGAVTWLLCEAKQRMTLDESLAMWMGREGFAWAGERLAEWMVEIRQKAAVLNSSELLRYLDLRDRLCTAEVGFLKQSASAWARLLEPVSEKL
ncbi:class 1 isoprenoid biosynthesis enzyme [Silvibacterium acidisoli]|uniref:class 1 isoprenoid biosynthesis enzyme n=1 Tax=Acidobacteriaceae bacterium ZG23-2 TaxID=2883246 RepID=UPI00406BFAD5